MASLSKNEEKERPRFGSDWDLDLGWVLFWLIMASMVASIVWAASWGAVRTNARNNQREETFYKSCRQIEVVTLAGSSKKTYECK